MEFQYGETEIEYLKKKDKKLGAAIERIGFVAREVQTDLFTSVVHSIVGQQISTAAQKTVWKRVETLLGEVSAETVCQKSLEELQSCGMSFRKAEYISDFAKKVQLGEFDLEGLWEKSDQEVIEALSSLKGIGVWTAEMLMTFCMQRPDVLSFGDFAIQRGMRMLYRHRSISREQFERYRRRYCPYGTVASLYFWAIAGGALPELQDPAPKKK